MMQSHSPDRLDQLWGVMQAEKGDIEARSEEYARWTLPYICPPDSSANSEQDKAEVSIGPRLVNHLSNKIVDTMYPHERPFFAVTLTPELRQRLRKEMGEDKEAQFSEAIREEAASVEEVAMRKMDLTAYRPKAIDACRHLIVTGNAIIRRMPDNSRVVYGIKDHCVRRDVAGQVQEVLLRDAKVFSALPQDLQLRVKQIREGTQPDTKVTLYSHFIKEGVRWKFRQGVDDVEIDNGTMYKPVDLPILCLVWNLSRGDNYGRGLVEDHTTAFHQIDVLTRAVIDMAGILADIKWLVDPSSTLDIFELNNSPRGSYHSGREGDITSNESARRVDIGSVHQIISGLQQELAQAFLLNTSAVRDAERVTAEEIRFIAMELEGAFGGLYSRLALEWQKHEAEYAVSQINFNTELPGNISAFEVVVTTGLESLSREGQLDNLRRAVADLQMLQTIPDEFRAQINPNKFASFIFTNHSVKYKEFLFTPDEVQQNQEAQMQQQEQLMQMQVDAQAQGELGKQAAQGAMNGG